MKMTEQQDKNRVTVTQQQHRNKVTKKEKKEQKIG